VTVTLGNNPGGSSLGGTTTVAAVSGVATFATLTLDKTSPGYGLTATATGLTTATSGSFNITAGTASQLVFGTEPGTTLAATRSRGRESPRARRAREPRDGLHGQCRDCPRSNPGGGTLSGTTPVPAVGGVATFSDLIINRVGRATRS